MARRRWWPTLLAAGLLLSAAQPAYPATPLPAPQVQIQIDGQIETFDQSPYMIDGRTFLPLRAIFERLGAQVRWDQATQTITATRDQHLVSLQIGSDQAFIDGRSVTLSVPPMLVANRAYVPVRFVSEALGGYVGWDGKHQLVSIVRADERRSGRTRAEIQQRWQAAQPRPTGGPLLSLASIHPPFQAGALQAGVLDDGLRMLNFVRYLAYLPDDVTLDATYSDLAQHAAVINAYYGGLNHHPARPESMTDRFYDLALRGSSQSNLGAGYNSPADAIQRGYMDDSDPANIDRVGHRRWILSPRMGKVGFGWVPSPERYGAFDALYVFDASRKAAPAFSHWAWPSAGYFPTSFFGPEQAWSIGVNPGRVVLSGAVAVTLTRASDGKTWRFGPSAASAFTAASSLTAANSSLTAANSSLTASNSSLTASNSSLTAANSSLTASNSSLTAANSSLAAANSSLAAANSSLATSTSSLAAANSSLAASTSSLAASASSLAASTSSPAAGGGYFRVDTAGYGYTQAIIFRPEGLAQLSPEESYQVTVSGLTDKAGAPFPLQYEVTFFQL